MVAATYRPIKFEVYPRRPRLGLIEATYDFRVGAVRYGDIRGVRASASLKPGASAHSSTISWCISEASAPRPHLPTGIAARFQGPHFPSLSEADPVAVPPRRRLGYAGPRQPKLRLPVIPCNGAFP